MDMEYHFYTDVLAFLREIKGMSLYSPKSKSGFPALNLSLDNNNNLKIKQQILYKLQEWDLITIGKQEQDKSGNQLVVNFELTPKFEKTYKVWELIWEDPFLVEKTRIVKISKLLKIKKQLDKHNLPICVVEETVGYLKFGKYGKKNKIGKSNSRHFKLLQSLTDPFRTAKTVDTVFEAIKLPQDSKDQRLLDPYRASMRKVELILFAVKELQKGNKMCGKLQVVFDDSKTMVWLEPIS